MVNLFPLTQGGSLLFSFHSVDQGALFLPVQRFKLGFVSLFSERQGKEFPDINEVASAKKIKFHLLTRSLLQEFQRK